MTPAILIPRAVHEAFVRAHDVPVESEAERAARLARRCANYPRCRVLVTDPRFTHCAACAGWPETPLETERT